jgi:hypothetical protein
MWMQDRHIPAINGLLEEATYGRAELTCLHTAISNYKKRLTQ